MRHKLSLWRFVWCRLGVCVRVPGVVRFGEASAVLEAVGAGLDAGGRARPWTGLTVAFDVAVIGRTDCARADIDLCRVLPLLA
jgi:hypothetical protein